MIILIIILSAGFCLLLILMFFPSYSEPAQLNKSLYKIEVEYSSTHNRVLFTPMKLLDNNFYFPITTRKFTEQEAREEIKKSKENSRLSLKHNRDIFVD